MSFILNCEPLSNSVWVTIEFFLFLHDYKYPTENTISTLSMRREPEYTWNVYLTPVHSSPLFSVRYLIHIHRACYVYQPNPNVSTSISKSRPHIEMYCTGSEFTSCRHCDRWREMTRATSQFCVHSLYTKVLHSLTIYQFHSTNHEYRFQSICTCIFFSITVESYSDST